MPCYDCAYREYTKQSPLYGREIVAVCRNENEAWRYFVSWKIRNPYEDAVWLADEKSWLSEVYQVPMTKGILYILKLQDGVIILEFERR